ncbi:hypothetical protein RBQ61_10560 [Sedimentibacter sp. MB35-C1]|uniref:hypothetical protein n=1 Tax=Sedimentibacter sp. MB35-C1 TaxID=3070995 RepID=UPI0027E1F632|nr:hypothetical protein [Sedimentibacter sp. MB35-C1]WMJ76067.1 hypothetical protein RBQ61_10560 [Sedimentibacter sp. MB35-C1]
MYRPIEIERVYEGLYIDKDIPEVSEKVSVSIDCIVTKNMLLKPKTFIGDISINSSLFRIEQPIQFDKVTRTFRLTLDAHSVNSVWKFYDSEGMFEHLGDTVYWSIYVDGKISKITFIPLLENSSSSERVVAPCNNREEAINLSQFLNSGGFK